VMITSTIYDPDERMRSYQLVAEASLLPERAAVKS